MVRLSPCPTLERRLVSAYPSASAFFSERSLQRSRDLAVMKRAFLICLLCCGSMLARADDHIKLEMVDCFLDDCSVVSEFPGIEFGYLTVPENHDVPEGNQVRVAFAIVRSRESNPEPDPILIFQGGWGVSSLRGISWRAQSFPIQNRDLILFDYRGTGYSEPLLCPGLGEKQWELVIQDLGYRDFNDRLNALAYDCLQSLENQGIDYRQFGTEVKTRDALILLEKLGIDEVNLYGVSNGTMGIQGFLRAAEGSNIRIRSALSDSNVPMGHATHAAVIRTYKDVLGNILDDCASQPQCAQAFPNLKERFRAFLRDMGEEALVHGGEQEIFFNLMDINGLIHQLLYSYLSYKDVPIILEAVMAGELDFFAALYDTFQSRVVEMNGAALINFVYDRKGAQEDVRRVAQVNLAEIPEFKVLTSFYLDFFLNDTMMGYNPRDRIPVTSDVPVLLLVGSYDPITPPELTEIMHERYANSFFFVLPRIGHGSVYHPCGQALFRSFIENPREKPASECVDALKQTEIPFTTSYYPNQKILGLVRQINQDRHIGLISGILLAVLFGLALPIRQIILSIKKQPVQWMHLMLPVAVLAFFASVAYYVMQTLNAGGLLILFGLVGGAAWLPWLGLLIMVLAAAGVLRAVINRSASVWGLGMLLSGLITAWIALGYGITPF